MPVGTLLVVGGWVLSPIIKELIGEVKSLLGSKYTSFADFAKHLQQLADVLEQIRATVEAVQEGRRNDDVFSSGGMVSWVGRLVDAIHEVESVLDDFAYDDIYMSNLRDNKVAQFAHSAATTGRRLIGIDKAFNRLKKLLGELPVIQQSLRDLAQAQLPQIHAGSSRSMPRRATGPLLPAATARELFVGYEQEYDRLVSALVNNMSDRPSSSNNIVAVIGHSRSGKTTIARRAWHDKRIKEHFQLMVWVSVSYMFGEMELLTEIWKSIPSSSRVDEKCAAAEMSFSNLQQVVHGLVGSRRYLLVLDDVCNDESGHDRREKMKATWEGVLAPFKDGGPGSRIMITSRASICARMLGAGTRITLSEIGAADLVLLLKKTAFGDERKKTPDLDDVIMKVAEQLNGSPSAAKASGDEMRNKYRKKDWKKHLEKTASWYCGAGVGATLAGASSYGDMPPHLQSCLGFCGMFPDRWEFVPDTLVKMWIAHGIISDSRHSMEDVGRDYVRDLQAWSMLKSTSKVGRETCFVIHEQVHSMLQSVSSTHFFRLGNDDRTRKRSIPASVRHLSLTGGGCLAAMAQLKDDPVLKKLRTLLVFDDGSGSSSSNTVAVIDNHVLKQLKAVIVLDFAGTRIAELPKGIGKLTHLRYLGLPNSVGSLPDEVTKLLHLQTLSVGKDCKLDDDHGFPADGMRSLINLRHLDMDMKYIGMIRGIGRLGKLQGSVEFCADRGKGHGMEELAGIDSLHGTLTVKGLQVVASKEEAQKAQLGKKESLKVLKLEWEPPKLGQRDCSTSSSQEEVLEGLEPHPKIEELHIQRYQGTSSPSWLGSSGLLTSLSHLYLINCRNWLMLPCLSGLPELRVLHIKEMYSVARIDHRLYGGGGGALRLLEKLVLDDLPILVEWSAEATDEAFPRLEEILILNCPKLVKLPRVPSTVRKMRIENVKNMRIEKDSSYYLDMSFSSKSNSFTLDVHGDAVRLLHQDFLHQDHAVAISALSIKKYEGEDEVNVNLFSSVRSLSLSRCVVTDRQLLVFFENLQSLKTLQISDCIDLCAFPEGAMPPSMKSIELKGCHPTLVEKLRASARINSIARVHID